MQKCYLLKFCATFNMFIPSVCSLGFLGHNSEFKPKSIHEPNVKKIAALLPEALPAWALPGACVSHPVPYNTAIIARTAELLLGQ